MLGGQAEHNSAHFDYVDASGTRQYVGQIKAVKRRVQFDQCSLTSAVRARVSIDLAKLVARRRGALTRVDKINCSQ